MRCSPRRACRAITIGPCSRRCSIYLPRNFARASKPPTSRSCIRASPSRSMATTRAPSAYFPTTLLPRIIPHAEWRKIENGLTQRIAALNLVPRGHLSPWKDPGGWRCPARTGVQLPPLPPRNARTHRSTRNLRQHLRHRSCASARRQLCRARRQSAGAQRRIVHAGEPEGAEEAFPHFLPRLRRVPSRSLRASSAGHAARAGSSRFLDAARAESRPSHTRSFSTQPISSTRSSRSRWASSWSRAAISWCTTT